MRDFFSIEFFKDCNLLPTFYNESDAFLIHKKARMQKGKNASDYNPTRYYDTTQNYFTDT